jgi:hypothetical protein
VAVAARHPFVEKVAWLDHTQSPYGHHREYVRGKVWTVLPPAAHGHLAAVVVGAMEDAMTRGGAGPTALSWRRFATTVVSRWTEHGYDPYDGAEVVARLRRWDTA